MGDDIDSMLGEEEKQIELEEFKEERERRASKNKGKPLRSAPLGMDDDDIVGMGDLAPAELGSIDHHAEEVRLIEEKLILPSSAAPAAGKKKIPGTQSVKQQSRASQPGLGSTKKQKERYSKE